MMLRERFTPFVTKEDPDNNLQPPVLEREDDAEGSGPRFSDDEEEEEVPTLSKNNSSSVVESVKPSKKEKSRRSKSASASSSAASDGESKEEEDELDEDLKEMIKELKNETDVEKKCELMENLVKEVISEQLDYDLCQPLAVSLSDAMQEEFEGRIFPIDDQAKDTIAAPEPPSDQAIEDSIGKPIFVLFRALCEMSENDPVRGIILQLLADLYALQSKLGYYLLYFLSADTSVHRTPKERASVYRDLCQSIDDKYSLDLCLVNDMRQCQEDEVSLFVFLIPEIFSNFPKHSVGNVDLLYLVVSCVNGNQIQTLVCNIVSKDFIMFKKDSFQTIMNSSLTWETFEQCALWQLASAHDLPIDCVLPLVPKLSFSQHSEALTQVLLLLKDERPTAEAVKLLLSRESERGDRFVTSVFSHWMNEYDDKLGDLISNHLSKIATSGSSGNKRKRGRENAGSGIGSGKNSSNSPGSQLSPSAELCLVHLDQLRQRCKQYEFFSQRSITSSFQQVRAACTESQKKKFMDLFVLADSDSEPETNTTSNSKKKSSSSKGGSSMSSSAGASSKSPSKARSKASKASAAAAPPPATDSSEESSEESDESEKLPLMSRGGGGGGGSKRGSGSGGSNRSKNPRKRKNKVSSYKISSEESSDDTEVRKAPKKKKKISNSDSD